MGSRYVLWRRDRKILYAQPTDSVSFVCAQRTGTFGQYWLGNTRPISQAGTIGACAGAVGAWEYPCDQSVNASTGYICQAKPDYVPFDFIEASVRVTQDCLQVFYRHIIVGSPCLKIMHAQLSPTATDPECSKDHANPQGTWVLTVLSFTEPVNSLRASFDLGMCGVHFYFYI